jgi:chorismate mutase
MSGIFTCGQDAAGGPLLIAGPCAAESREQVVQTAMAMEGIPGLFAFRAGLWKPRTRPGAFEGVGVKGLAWLQEAREKTGLKLAVEIAVPAHAEACLRAGIDIMWIGARTVVSPFVVDDIAGVLSGSTACIMVKNPLNPDAGLWTGGVERLQQAGIGELAMVHRGFDAFASHPYRNAPLWEIPMEMQQRFPGLPMLCDPSHIGGSRNLLPEIAQKALDLGMQGLMIETHIDPDKALTDQAQQLSPDALRKLARRLQVKKADAGGFDATLESYRTTIDGIDEQLLGLLARRMKVSELIGRYKKEHRLAPYQPGRWAALLENRLEKGSRLQLDHDFVTKLFNLIHLGSLKKQG